VEVNGINLMGATFEQARFFFSQFKNNYFAEMCSGSEKGSYLRLMDFFITQL